MKNYELDAKDNEFSAFYLNDNHLIIDNYDENDMENDSPEPQKADKSADIH